MERMNRWIKSAKSLWAGACLFGVAAIIPTFGVRMPFMNSGNPDVAAIQQVVSGALAAEQQADIRPTGVPTGSAATPQAVQTFMQHVPAMAASEMQAWHRQLGTTLAQYYTGSRLTQLSRIMWDHASDQSAAGASDIELAGGVDNVQFKSIVVTGDTATAQVEATKWLRYAHRGNGHVDIISTPPSAALYKYQLVRTPDGWRISELTDFTILANAP